MKKVVYISGTRADFNLMTRTLLELNKQVDLIIIATGMHLSERWGNTINEIEKYNFNIRKVDIQLENESLSSMVNTFGEEVKGLNRAIKDISPNLILVEGDRGEALAGAIIGAHLNIPVVHHGGGDISDSIDNKIRNAISMFSDYHLTGNFESFNRLLSYGISKSKVFNVGEPGLDEIIANNFTPRKEIIQKFNINSNAQLLLLIFYPNTNEFDEIQYQITEVLEAIRELKIPTIGLYSNADAGGAIINRVLDEYKIKLPFLKLYTHFYREDFSGLMNICNAMVGNSSAGITELPLFKKPYICIGTRQKGRLMAGNVIEVDYKKKNIVQAVNKGLYNEDFKKKLKELENPYGDGKAYLRITKIIKEILNS